MHPNGFFLNNIIPQTKIYAVRPTKAQPKDCDTNAVESQCLEADRCHWTSEFICAPDGTATTFLPDPAQRTFLESTCMQASLTAPPLSPLCVGCAILKNILHSYLIITLSSLSLFNVGCDASQRPTGVGSAQIAAALKFHSVASQKQAKAASGTLNIKSAKKSKDHSLH